MSDEPQNQVPQRFQIGHSSIGAMSLARLFYFLRGEMILGVIFAAVFRSFLGRHPGLTLLFGAAYLALCAFLAYRKVAYSKPPPTDARSSA